MRKTTPSKLEEGRERTGYYKSDSSFGFYGRFFVMGPCGTRLTIVASGADKDDELSHGWEHVSVSTLKRTPNWLEMSFVKDLFWSEEECVVQFHPPRSEYVNNHPNVLHLWKNKHIQFPMPPSILVGRKDLGELTYEQVVALRKAEGV
jgi:hypothetical protein